MLTWLNGQEIYDVTLAPYGKWEEIKGKVDFSFEPKDACNSINRNLDDHIAIIEDVGCNCTFTQKLRRVQESNARAAIIFSHCQPCSSAVACKDERCADEEDIIIPSVCIDDQAVIQMIKEN